MNRNAQFFFRVLWPLACLATLLPNAYAQSLTDRALTQISFEQKLNTQVSLALSFRDEKGEVVQLQRFFDQKPVILVLGYYECPMLCTLVLNGLVESLQDLKWSIGREFDVLCVSINPQETPSLAAAKRRIYLKRYGRSGADGGWHFLTGDQGSIRAITAQVGFEYLYDRGAKQYAHPSGVIILTPQGKVAGYMFGITYPPWELLGNLQRAGKNQAGSPIRQLLLLCFHYNPITGKYGPTIMLLLRLASVATLLLLAGLVIRLTREKHTVSPTRV